MHGSFHQPLVSSHPYHDSTRRHFQGSGGHEVSSLQNYRPPTLIEDGRGSAGPRRAIPNRTSHSSGNLRPGFHQDDPSADLSWGLFSNGCLCIQCVRTQEVGIVENCGSFHEVIGPGLYSGGVWPFHCIVARLSLRVQQLDINIETKTKDDVFVNISVSVHFRILVEYAYDAYYRLTDANLQIRTLVYDVIRSLLPRLDLDQVFASKSEVSDAVFTRLQSVMKDFGYEIVATLVAKISPNELVKHSMNEVNASRRIKEAAPHRAEAGKYEKVKAAEAHSETLYLHGVGIARQRSVLSEGLRNSVNEHSDQTVMTPSEVMDLLLVSQYVDTLVAVGANELIIRPTPDEIRNIKGCLPNGTPPTM